MVTFSDVLQDHPLHQNQYTYQTGKYTETTLVEHENTCVECSETPAGNLIDFIFVVPCIMLNSEIIPTRCNNCVYSSQCYYRATQHSAFRGTARHNKTVLPTTEHDRQR